MSTDTNPADLIPVPLVRNAADYDRLLAEARAAQTNTPDELAPTTGDTDPTAGFRRHFEKAHREAEQYFDGRLWEERYREGLGAAAPVRKEPYCGIV